MKRLNLSLESSESNDARDKALDRQVREQCKVLCLRLWTYMREMSTLGLLKKAR